MMSRTSSTPLLLAPSISRTSSELPRAISRQAGHSPQGRTVGPLAQFRAFARIRAVVVFPDTADSGEQERVRDPVLLDGVSQGPGDGLLPDKVLEDLGTILESQHLVGHRQGSFWRPAAQATRGTIEDPLTAAPFRA